MQVYVVEGLLDYEPGEVLSVESSVENAEKFVANYRARAVKHDEQLSKGIKPKIWVTNFNGYNIYRFTVDSPNTRKIIKKIEGRRG